MLKPLLIIHRYLGVLLGILMSLWCLSGFVMMYQGYPATTESERQQGLQPLDFSQCCNLNGELLDNLSQSPGFQIEMLNGAPVLRTDGGQHAGEIISLDNGSSLALLKYEEVMNVARQFAQGAGIDSEPVHTGTIGVDQWTVQAARRNTPVHKIRFNDAAGSVIYISGKSGRVFQDTNRRERILTWLGAIPHWLYPLQLRQNGPLWSQIVIWSSLLGVFLTATGLYVGISRLHRRASDRKIVSPFRGWWYWHHITGLFFGILVLTWVFSGLLTMNPWGWLAGDMSMFSYRNDIRGQTEPNDARRFLQRLPDLPGSEYVHMETTAYDNQLYILATSEDGSIALLDSQGMVSGLSDDQIRASLEKLPMPLKSFSLMSEEDQYYYAYKGNERDLPVYRAIFDDEQQTRLYINPANADITTVDANQRLNRWTRIGLHRLDFSFMKSRPVWDGLVLILLTGVTVVCITGTWMSIRRIKLDTRRIRRKWQ